MKVAVWDTYVPRHDGLVMHFDIIAPDHIKDENIIHNFGRDYLQRKGKTGLPLTAKECRLCHIEQAGEEIVAGIHEKGYYIIEMQHCD